MNESYFMSPDRRQKNAWTLWDFFVGFYRVIVGGSLAFLACTIILWSDRHNDERYIKQVDFKSSLTEIGDERYIKRDAFQEAKGQIEKRLDTIESQARSSSAETDRKLSEIQRDIKDILWRMGGGGNPDHR